MKIYRRCLWHGGCTNNSNRPWNSNTASLRYSVLGYNTQVLRGECYAHHKTNKYTTKRNSGSQLVCANSTCGQPPSILNILWSSGSDGRYSTTCNGGYTAS